MDEFNKLFGGVLPVVENWLRTTVAEEVNKALMADRQKAHVERTLTVDEVCEVLHVSKPTLWTRTKEGKIKAVKKGRRVLYSESEVRRYLSEKN
jgi:excisionase family DNA binding protein